MTVAERLQAEQKKQVAGVETVALLAEDDHWNALVKEKKALDDIKHWAEARLKLIGPEIEVGLMAAEVEGVRMAPGYVVKIGRGRAADQIKAQKLLELGVPVDTVAAATVEGKPYTFAQILSPKQVGRTEFRTWEEVEEAARVHGYAE